MMKKGAAAMICLLGCTTTHVAAQSSCAEDVNSDGAVDVNDLLSLLSGFGGSGADGSDVNGDGSVDVNDLLQLLSSFGADCAPAEDCAQGESCGGQVWNDCGSMCPPTCGVQMGMACPDMCQAGFQCPPGQMWDPIGQCVASSDCSVSWTGPLPPMAPPGGGGGGGPIIEPEPGCALGSNCGGQEWNDCGSSCPLVCGQMIGMCNMMCNAAYQCPSVSRCGAQHFDDVIGQCVCNTECTNGATALPPGMAIGRPFLSAKAAPMLAPALEQAASDWAAVL